MTPGTRITNEGSGPYMVVGSSEHSLTCLYSGMMVVVPRQDVSTIDSAPLPCALTIGSYRLPDFVELNIVLSRMVYGDIPILVSDDRSLESPLIQDVAAKHDCHYLCTTGRMAHCGGDIQHFINAAEFASQEQKPFAIKQSCRFIPLAGIEQVWREGFQKASLIVPGQIKAGQIARPNAAFYQKFGLLTDCVGWKTGSLTGQDIAEHYRATATQAKHAYDNFVEIAWGRLAQAKFKHDIVVDDRLANHEVGKPKLYLRKAQSGRQEYENVAKAVGVTGQFDIREWKAIEGPQYRCFAEKL